MCGLIATGVLVAASRVHVHPIALVLASGTIVLLLARTALSFRENAELLETSRHEALTDVLTGLANRRKLLSISRTTSNVHLRESRGRSCSST